MPTRRNFITQSIGTLALSSVMTEALAESIAPHVFLDYSQGELDVAFDQALWAPKMKELDDQMSAASLDVRRRTPPKTIQYGQSSAEALDIFSPPNTQNAPILIFIHGGAWIRLTKDDASYPAPMFNQNGVIYVVPNYAPLSSVRMPEIVEQCRRAVGWVVRNATRLGGDANQIYIAGHSAGAHLAACMLTTDWVEHGLTTNPIKEALLLSGLYELRPVVLSSRRSYIHLNKEEINALSPMRHLDRIETPVNIVTADQDSPEFRRQSEIFASALDAMGLLKKREVLFNTNHFSEAQSLSQPGSPVSQLAMQMLKP